MFDGLGCYKNFEHDMDFVENPKFRIIPPRRIPHATRNDVKSELDRMTDLGVMSPITEPTPAVSPLMIVKRNDKLRICMDPTELNKNIHRRHYPLKTIEIIAARVNGSQYFFWQIKVSERTKQFLAMATPWGRYVWNRLPFGLSSAPDIFSEILNEVLKSVTNVEIAMDSCSHKRGIGPSDEAGVVIAS